MTLRNFILTEDKRVIEEHDWIKFAIWFENPQNRIIKQETIGKYWISTVFLGMDHSFSGAPILFETMIFVDSDKDIDKYQERCSTYQMALQMHERIAQMVRDRILQKQQ